jgi:hypothetical protein
MLSESVFLTIIQPAGSGKTTALVIILLVLMIQFGNGCGSAPTNVACDNLAGRAEAIDEQVSRAVGYVEDNIYDADDADDAPATPHVDAGNTALVVETPSGIVDSQPNKISKERHFSLRGYDLDTEREAFMYLLEHPDFAGEAIKMAIWRPSTTWRFPLSAASYLCLVLGLPAAGCTLVPEDSHRLHALAKSFRHDHTTAGVRALASGKIGFGEYSRRQEYLSDKSVARLLRWVIEAAHLVVTTPALPWSGPMLETEGKDTDVAVASKGKGNSKEISPYSEARNNATWFAIDEAGAMTRADALTVLGNTGQPSVLGGDHLQLPPFVASPMDKNGDGDALNPHAADTGISMLAWHMYSGLPVFRMFVQWRMSKGQFDLAGKHVYRELNWKHGQICDISLPQHEPGRLLEDFARVRFPGLTAPKAGELTPLFVHIPGKTIKDQRSGSKFNQVQNRIALDLLSTCSKPRASIQQRSPS